MIEKIQSTYLKHINFHCLHISDNKIKPELAIAIIETESGGNPDAVRYEKDFNYINDARGHAKRIGISMETEKKLQQFSFGLFQIMGATARDLGFMGNLVKLLDPEINIRYGISLLKKLHSRYGEKIDDIIAAYNQGDNRLNPKTGLYQNIDYVNNVKNNLSRIAVL